MQRLKTKAPTRATLWCIGVDSEMLAEPSSAIGCLPYEAGPYIILTMHSLSNNSPIIHYFLSGQTILLKETT